MSRKICVVGAGVIGLSSAVRIQKQFPECDINIVADRFSPNTTSDGAGAIVAAFATNDTPFQLIKKWTSETKCHLESIVFSPEASQARVQILSGYEFGDQQNEVVQMYTGNHYGYHDLNEEELNLFPKSSWGKFYTTLQVDCTSYLPWLMKRFCDNGGVVLRKKINSLQELYGEYDMIINCSGLGSSQLVHDKEVLSARGETIRVVAPWIKHFVIRTIGNELTYIIPGSNNVVLGGTYQKDNWNYDSSEKDRNDIWKRCLDLIPSLKDAKIEYHWVGLRPVRNQIRLEMEQSPSKDCWIIHNYGHGGYGITVHWGCAGEVVDLVIEAFQKNIKNSKL